MPNNFLAGLLAYVFNPIYPHGKIGSRAYSLRQTEVIRGYSQIATILIDAAAKGNRELVDKLITAGAIYKDYAGNDAFTYAVRAGYGSIVE
ncbi:MAG: ankyrin repeat domain-containing protein [Candidatus Midichloria mitochondrii]